MGVRLPSYPVVAPPAWCSRYVGLPYEEGARGPAKWDCWGLLWLVLQEQFGVEVPNYEGVGWSRKDGASRKAADHHFRDEALANWIEIPAGWEQPGDALALSIARRPLHVGIVATPGWMLHSAEDSDAALERYDGMAWRNRVLGFYRHRRMTA